MYGAVSGYPLSCVCKQKIQVSFPELINTGVTTIVELECYKALGKIKAILEDDALADSECFQQIEETVCTFEELDSGDGNRHDFG